VIGGLEQVVYDLACSLVEMGHKVVVFATKGSKAPPKGFLCETIEPIYNVHVDWFNRERQAYEKYKALLRDFDIIHSHSWYHFPYLAKMENPELKVCATHHGHLNFRTKPVEKMNLIAISRFMAEEYASILKTNVRFVYNGIDLKKYPFKKEKGDSLLFVGRISKLKRPDIAIEIAKRLGMKLDICGGTFVEDQSYIQQIKHLCEANGFGFYPDATHEVKVGLMQNAKALIFPSSFKEPFGLVAVEALSCGTPVVAVMDGAIPEIVKDGKVGFVCNSIDGMVEAVKRIDNIKPEDCRALVEQNFTKELMAKRYEDLYKQVVNNSEW
jgi:glycosyltransferase involved in cell wall biosynthesis